MPANATAGDPTRAELLAFLEREHRSVGDDTHTDAESEADDHDGCGCRFDIEEAAWNLAAHWHGGQSSNLYAALSSSEYDPGCAGDLPDDLDDEDCERVISTLLYLAGDDWIRAGCPTEEVTP